MQQKKSFIQIQTEWEKIQTLDIKSKLKAMRAIAHDIAVSYDKKETDIEQLTFYMQIIKQVARTRSFPQPALLFLSKLIADWLVLTGNDKSKIIFKKAGIIPVDTASISISDQSFNIYELDGDFSDKNYLSLINQGKCYIFSTGADGMYNVQLRVIDALEPVLTNGEFKYVTESSASAIIHIPTGIIAITDGLLLDKEFPHLSASIMPGNYKISVYQFYIPNKLESFYIVLCKTDREASNDFSNIYTFT